MAEQTLEQQRDSERRGNELDFELLLLLILVRQDDIALATATWQRFAPQPYKSLINARPVTPGPSPAFPRLRVAPSPYRWNEDLYRYVGRNGMTIRPRELKQAVNSFIRAAAAESANLTARMNRGEISIGEWEGAFAAHVKAVHLAADIVGQGGAIQVEQLDLKRMEGVLETQMDALRAFVTGVVDLTVPDAAAIARANLYIASANPTFETSVHSSYGRMVATGLKVEMRNRMFDGAEHCATSLKRGTTGCQEETRRGWAMFGTMSLPGRRSCAAGCKCFVQYRVVKP